MTMKTQTLKFLTIPILFALAALASLTACSSRSGGPFAGTVVEEKTGKPIAGAWVAVNWMIHLPGAPIGGGGGSLHCFHTEIAQTDAKGKYSVPRWTISLNEPDTPEWLKPTLIPSSTHIETAVYLRGYRISYTERPGWPEHLAMFKDTSATDERIEHLDKLDMGCAEGKFLPALQAMRAEVAEIPRSEKQNRFLKWLTWSIGIRDGTFTPKSVWFELTDEQVRKAIETTKNNQ
jgi:hypothetical protein